MRNLVPLLVGKTIVSIESAVIHNEPIIIFTLTEGKSVVLYKDALQARLVEGNHLYDFLLRHFQKCTCEDCQKTTLYLLSKAEDVYDKDITQYVMVVNHKLGRDLITNSFTDNNMLSIRRTVMKDTSTEFYYVPHVAEKFTTKLSDSNGTIVLNVTNKQNQFEVKGTVDNIPFSYKMKHTMGKKFGYVLIDTNWNTVDLLLKPPEEGTT